MQNPGFYSSTNSHQGHSLGPLIILTFSFFKSSRGPIISRMKSSYDSYLNQLSIRNKDLADIIFRDERMSFIIIFIFWDYYNYYSSVIIFWHALFFKSAPQHLSTQMQRRDICNLKEINTLWHWLRLWLLKGKINQVDSEIILTPDKLFWW